MAISSLPLSYCTNVHPGQSVAEVEAGLDRYAVDIARQLGRPLAAGLWLAKPVVDELLTSADGVVRFAEGLSRRGLSCHTLNAFPYGNFHSARVKENVYLPDWTTADRLKYTVQCAQVLAGLMPEETEGSISTLPLGFKGFEHADDFWDATAGKLVETAKSLAAIYDQTGKRIRLAIEPEPFCMLETTGEAIAYFGRLRAAARQLRAEDAVQEYIGLCYDVCHQAVEFENISDSIHQLDRSGIRINKVHLSCALQLDQPATNLEGRTALKQYVEERYLHQTMAKTPAGRVVRTSDLSNELIEHPDLDFLSASAWRVHYHVPVDAERMGPLGTTRPQLKTGIAAVARLNYAPHLEVETYTWHVLPGQQKPDLATGLARELRATQQLLDSPHS